jgi:NTE family protein
MKQLPFVEIAAMAAKARRAPERPPFECIALLLQGGGALGSYQAGVYAALAEAELQPDWVAGISIGAINGALIAGNAPEWRVEQLRKFWEQITAAPHGLDAWLIATNSAIARLIAKLFEWYARGDISLKEAARKAHAAGLT